MPQRKVKPAIIRSIEALALVVGIENERACELLLGSDDGKWIFESIFAALKNKTVAQEA
jgi:hypothetical protein